MQNNIADQRPFMSPEAMSPGEELYLGLGSIACVGAGAYMEVGVSGVALWERLSLPLLVTTLGYMGVKMVAEGWKRLHQ